MIETKLAAGAEIVPMCDNDVRRTRNIILSRRGMPNGCSNRIPTKIAAAVAADNWRVYLRRRSGNAPNGSQNYYIKVEDGNQNVRRALSYFISSEVAST